jgi:hypothetical protein
MGDRDLIPGRGVGIFRFKYGSASSDIPFIAIVKSPTKLFNIFSLYNVFKQQTKNHYVEPE